MDKKKKLVAKKTIDNSIYCTNCGSRLDEGQDVCLKCGILVKKNRFFNRKEENKSKKKSDKPISFNLIEMVAIIIITSIVVATASSIVVYNNYSKIDEKLNSKKNVSEIEKAYKQILEHYYGQVSEDELTNAAIQGMYMYLGDPYSSYLDENTAESLKDKLKGEFTGLGIEFTLTENGNQIKNVFEGTPADINGLKAGDYILTVDGIDVRNVDPNVISGLIKNTDLEKTVITISRDGEEITKEIKLARVIIPSVSSSIYDNVGYLNISTFSNTTLSQVEEKLKELESQNIEGLVIDLRGNGGGLLNSAVDIASLFIEKGAKIYGLQNSESTKYYTDTTKASRNYKISVLIDSNSASASEILAAALKESYGATLVGVKSFGKGTVQETSDLSTGAMVKYTTGYWLTPKGNNINEVGLTPDIEVVNSEEGIDNQLEKAIEAVK